MLRPVSAITQSRLITLPHVSVLNRMNSRRHHCFSRSKFVCVVVLTNISVEQNKERELAKAHTQYNDAFRYIKAMKTKTALLRLFCFSVIREDLEFIYYFDVVFE